MNEFNVMDNGGSSQGSFNSPQDSLRSLILERNAAYNANTFLNEEIRTENIVLVEKLMNFSKDHNGMGFEEVYDALPPDRKRALMLTFEECKGESVVMAADKAKRIIRTRVQDIQREVYDDKKRTEEKKSYLANAVAQQLGGLEPQFVSQIPKNYKLGGLVVNHDDDNNTMTFNNANDSSQILKVNLESQLDDHDLFYFANKMNMDRTSSGTYISNFPHHLTSNNGFSVEVLKDEIRIVYGDSDLDSLPDRIGLFLHTGAAKGGHWTQVMIGRDGTITYSNPINGAGLEVQEEEQLRKLSKDIQLNIYNNVTNVDNQEIEVLDLFKQDSSNSCGVVATMNMQFMSNKPNRLGMNVAGINVAGINVDVDGVRQGWGSYAPKVLEALRRLEIRSWELEQARDLGMEVSDGISVGVSERDLSKIKDQILGSINAPIIRDDGSSVEIEGSSVEIDGSSARDDGSSARDDGSSVDLQNRNVLETPESFDGVDGPSAPNAVVNSTDDEESLSNEESLNEQAIVSVPTPEEIKSYEVSFDGLLKLLDGISRYILQDGVSGRNYEDIREEVSWTVGDVLESRDYNITESLLEDVIDLFGLEGHKEELMAISSHHEPIKQERLTQELAPVANKTNWSSMASEVSSDHPKPITAKQLESSCQNALRSLPGNQDSTPGQTSLSQDPFLPLQLPSSSCRKQFTRDWVNSANNNPQIPAH